MLQTGRAETEKTEKLEAFIDRLQEIDQELTCYM